MVFKELEEQANCFRLLLTLLQPQFLFFEHSDMNVCNLPSACCKKKNKETNNQIISIHFHKSSYQSISGMHKVPFYFLLQIKQENLPSTGKDFIKAKYQLSYKLW